MAVVPRFWRNNGQKSILSDSLNYTRKVATSAKIA